MNARIRGDDGALVRRFAAPALVVLALLGTLSVFASGAAARKHDVTTVTLIAAARETVALNAAIARFEQQYPNIDINPTYGPVTAPVLSGLAAGTAPDIMSLGVGGAPSAGIPSVWAFGPRYLVDLSGRPWAKQLWQPLLPLLSVAGKVYAAPLTNAVLTVVYNKDLFAQLGLTPPTTWAGLLAQCNQISDQGKVPIKLPGADALSMGFVGAAMSANTVYSTDPTWGPKRAAGKVTFKGTPGWRQALQSLLDMKGARCFDPSPTTVTAAAAYSAFNAGQAPMMITSSGDAVLNIQQVNPALNIGFFPLPGQNIKSTWVLINPLVNLTVNAASPVKQQALQFLDFIGRSWQSVAFSNDENAISSLDAAKGVAPVKLGLFGPSIKEHRLAISPLNWANNPNGAAVFRAGIIALLAGTKTIDQVLAEVDAAW
jgi:raffinose/stachyose/melibiose transport system substrate-binding protein